MPPRPNYSYIDVAVGIIIKDDALVLLTQRPAGKAYEGWWELPGGKLEPGESVEDALARELHEELGLTIRSSAQWVGLSHHYQHANVRLHFCKVFDWLGEPVGLEGQAWGWYPYRQHRRLQAAQEAADFPLPSPVLPATEPILRWLSLD